eukprot:4149597-Pleurochrysis_carterae.AAC.2
MQVCCSPPFVSATKGPNISPDSLDPVEGQFLAVFVGAENNASTGKTMYRRWTLVALRDHENSVDVNCYVPLTKLSPPDANKPPFVPETKLTSIVHDVCCQMASEARKSSAAHKALMNAIKRQKVLIKGSSRMRSPILLSEAMGKNGMACVIVPVALGMPEMLLRKPSCTHRPPSQRAVFPRVYSWMNLKQVGPCG